MSHHEKPSKYTLPKAQEVDDETKVQHKTEGFKRIDKSNSLYENIKRFVLGVLLLQSPLRTLLLLEVLFVYWAYLRILQLLSVVGVISKETSLRYAKGAVPGGATYICWIFNHFEIVRYSLSEEQVNQIISKYEGRQAGDDAVADDRELEQYEKEIDELVPEFKKKKPYIVVTNHLCYQDPAISMNELGELSFVGKEALKQAPCVGILMQQLNCLFVGKQGGLVSQIIQRATDYYRGKHNSHLLIFPEGTTTIGTHILRFHDGSFVPGVPVQPFVFNFQYNSFNPCWADISEAQYMKSVFCQFTNKYCVVHFPPYYPTKTERRNPALYANNVRKLMIEGSNLVLSQVTGELKDSNLKFVRFLKKQQ